jgi:hypothetical protein
MAVGQATFPGIRSQNETAMLPSLWIFPIVGPIVFTPIFLALLLFDRLFVRAAHWRDTALAALRYTLGLILLLAGAEKLIRLPDIIGPHYLIDELAKYGLGLLGQFIAAAQVGIGFLLFSQRFALIGAIMALPMFANIFIVTVSLQWRGTPTEVAFFLFLNIVLLAADWPRLKWLLADKPADLDRLKTTPLARRRPRADALLLGLLLVLLAATVFGGPYASAARLVAVGGILIALAATLYFRARE